MRSFRMRRLETVVAILVVGGILFLAFGGYLGALSRSTSGVLLNLQEWVAVRYFAIRDFVTAPRDMAALQQRNAALEAEVARLQTQVIELEQKVAQTDVLAALVDFARANPENVYQAALVIGRDPSPFLRYVIINRGSNDGIRRGMPVVSDKGLVGRVDAVIADAARVQLITDADSVVSVHLQNADTDAVLRGSLTGDLVLDMISQDANVEVGDVVLTSSLGGTFPPDLLVGQVVSVRKLDYEIFQTAVVQPVVDFSRLQIVLVVTNFRPVDITPLLDSQTP